jgi:hypothetical protein
MKPFPSRPWPVAVVALSLLSAPGAAYAASRPHTHDDLVAHVSAVPGTTPFPTSGLPVGDAPMIPYAFASAPDFGEGNWRLERPDGTSVKLPRLTWSAWAPMGRGAIGMAGTEAGPELQRVTGDGRVRSRLVQHVGRVIAELRGSAPTRRRDLAEHSEPRWGSIRRFAILGRRGHVVRAWTFHPGRHRTLTQLTWEDAHHLLGVLLVHARWGLVRIGTDGTVEYAGPTVPTTGEFSPYDLPLS